MKREILRDDKFKILGYIDVEENGRQVLKGEKFRIIGYYEPQTNLTKDTKFRIVGKGNLLTMLLK